MKTIISLLKILNIIFLIIFGLGIVGSLDKITDFNLEMSIWVVIFLISPILSIIIVSIIKGKHEFCEWDKKERQKKDSFLTTVTLVVFFFTYLSIFFLSTSINDMFEINLSTIDRPEIIMLTLKLTFGILFLLNSIFSVQLHHSLYSDFLTIDNNLAKKPDNWDWENWKRHIHG
jgi:hypothetical protein